MKSRSRSTPFYLKRAASTRRGGVKDRLACRTCMLSTRYTSPGCHVTSAARSSKMASSPSITTGGMGLPSPNVMAFCGSFRLSLQPLYTAMIELNHIWEKKNKEKEKKVLIKTKNDCVRYLDNLLVKKKTNKKCAIISNISHVACS